MLRLADVLAMPVVRSADPQVLAAHAQLDRVVRWVHTTELSDIGPLLRGGDLVLTTGIALPETPDALSRFAGGLADSGAAGLLLELGRRWSHVPQELVSECERRGLPMVALRREVRFAAVAQAVGERLVDQQVAELRETHRVHDTFTELSIAEAGAEEVLDAVQRLAGAAVVLEDGDHRVLDYRAGPDDVDAVLRDWTRRSRRVQPDDRTAWDASEGWVVTLLGRRERRWGRLVIVAPASPSPRLVAVAERGAAALAMHRLHDRHRESRTRRLHHELLHALVADASHPDTLRRSELAGMPTDGHTFVGIVLRPAGAGRSGPVAAAQVDDIVTAALGGAGTVGLRCLAAAFEGEVRMLVAVPARADAGRTVDRLVAAVRPRTAVVAAAGTPVARLAAVGRTLREAGHVLAAVPGDPDPSLVVHRLEDVHVRGLLVLLADDDRLRGFVERELAPLREADAQRGVDLLRTARVVVEHWGNKSAAAAALHVSRPALYDRIARLEHVLRADLADAEVRTSLHLALLAAEAGRQTDI